MEISKVPDPNGAIADHDSESRPFPTSSPCLCINARTEVLRGFDSAGVGGGVWIADGSAFIVDRGLCEHTG